MSESNIIFETDSYYVYKVKPGIYEVREHKGTHSLVVGRFENEDEDEDTQQRAIEYCQDVQGYELLREKYLN